jgi:hypothetical protein
MTPTMFVELARARGGACAVGAGARVGRGALAAVAASIGYAAATWSGWAPASRDERGCRRRPNCLG